MALSPIRLLARTAARTSNLSSLGRGHQPDMTSSDASYCLSGLSPVLSSIAYWRFCGDNNQYDKVVGNLATKAMRHCRENNYKFKNTTIQRLAKAALLQLEQPVCPSCLGSPVTVQRNGNERLICGKCNGTGQKKLSIRATARCCGVDNKSITSNHLDTLHTLVTYLRECESRILKHVLDRVGE